MVIFWSALGFLYGMVNLGRQSKIALTSAQGKDTHPPCGLDPHLLGVQEYQKALECYSAAFLLDDGNVQYLLNSAAALFEMEEYMQCIKVL